MKLGTAPQPVNGSNAASAASLPEASGAARAGSPPPSLSVHPVLQPLPSAEVARQAAAQINEFLKSSAASVEFTVDGASDKVIVRVVDSETNQLIRQIPSADTLAIARALDRLTGLLLEQKA